MRDSGFNNINFENDKRNRRTNKAWTALIEEKAFPDDKDIKARISFDRPAYHQEYMRMMNENS